MEKCLSALDSLAEEYGLGNAANMAANPSEPRAVPKENTVKKRILNIPLKECSAVPKEKKAAILKATAKKATPKPKSEDVAWHTPPDESDEEDEVEDSSKRQKLTDLPPWRKLSSSSSQKNKPQAPIGARLSPALASSPPAKGRPTVLGEKAAPIKGPLGTLPPRQNFAPAHPIGAPMPRSSEVPKSNGLIQSLLAESEVAQRPKLSSETPRLEA